MSQTHGPRTFVRLLQLPTVCIEVYLQNQLLEKVQSKQETKSFTFKVKAGFCFCNQRASASTFTLKTLSKDQLILSVFTGTLVSPMQATANLDNLQSIKAVTWRFLVDDPLCDYFHEPAVRVENAHFSPATRHARGLKCVGLKVYVTTYTANMQTCVVQCDQVRLYKYKNFSKYALLIKLSVKTKLKNG